jgi:hypothetical protein
MPLDPLTAITARKDWYCGGSSKMFGANGCKVRRPKMETGFVPLIEVCRIVGFSEKTVRHMAKVLGTYENSGMSQETAKKVIEYYRLKKEKKYESICSF